MSKVLVTGATGFVGSHLVDQLLAQGQEVRVFVRSPSKLPEEQRAKVEVVQGELLDPPSLAQALQGIDVVYHIAGLIQAVQRGEFFRTNTLGCYLLFQAAAMQTSPPLVVLVSSLATVGPSDGQAPVGRETVPQPVSYYGLSKRGGELVAHQFAEQLPVTIVRPPVVFGPRDHAVLELFKPAARWGMLFLPAVKDFRMSLVAVDDLVNALLLAAKKGKHIARIDAGFQSTQDVENWMRAAKLAPRSAKQAVHAESSQGIYFVNASESPDAERLAELLASSLERSRVRLWRMRTVTIRVVGNLLGLWGRISGRAYIMNPDKAREATAGPWWCSDEPTRTELGYAPSELLETQLQQTAHWYREQGWL